MEFVSKHDAGGGDARPSPPPPPPAPVAATPQFDWIQQSIGKARWIPFARDRAIATAFGTPCPRPSEAHVYKDIRGAVSEWQDSAHESILQWLVLQARAPRRVVRRLSSRAGLRFVPFVLLVGLVYSARARSLDLPAATFSPVIPDPPPSLPPRASCSASRTRRAPTSSARSGAAGSLYSSAGRSERSAGGSSRSRACAPSTSACDAPLARACTSMRARGARERRSRRGYALRTRRLFARAIPAARERDVARAPRGRLMQYRRRLEAPPPLPRHVVVLVTNTPFSPPSASHPLRGTTSRSSRTRRVPTARTRPSTSRSASSPPSRVAPSRCLSHVVVVSPSSSSPRRAARAPPTRRENPSPSERGARLIRAPGRPPTCWRAARRPSGRARSPAPSASLSRRKEGLGAMAVRLHRTPLDLTGTTQPRVVAPHRPGRALPPPSSSSSSSSRRCVRAVLPTIYKLYNSQVLRRVRSAHRDRRRL